MTTRTNHSLATVAIGLLITALSACGSSNATGDSDPASGTCLAGSDECDDLGADDRPTQP